jgi:molybdopterin biosynthesis enzyme/molybdopterin-guanine dinucleotide biosynthesis protein A
MGGTDKPALVVAGTSLLDRAVAAVASCDRVVVVGPRRELAGGTREPIWVREDPAHGGPVAALAAGVAALDHRPSDDGTPVVVLAADMPWVTEADVQVLVEHLTSNESIDAVFASDVDGRIQYLYGVWRAHALRRALGDGTGVSGRSMRSLLPQQVATVRTARTEDIDTATDLDDALGRATLSVRDARHRVRSTVPLLPARSASVGSASNAVLAEPLRANTAFPRFDTSAMDGYAVAGDGPWTVRADIVFAGPAGAAPLPSGTAVRIATGARVPEGATSVVRDEHVVVDDDLLHLAPDAPARNDTRHTGEDWTAGTVLAPPGIAVTPTVLSTALSAGVDTVVIRGPATVRTVITGDEVRSRGPLADGQIRDSIGPVLPSFLRSCGFRPDGEVHTLDSEHGFDDVLTAASDVDVVIVVGATGGGAADRLRGALDRAGARIVVGSVACRPGGSSVIALLPGRRVVFGLPGNPYAAVATLLCLGPSIAAALTGVTSGANATGVMPDPPTTSTATRLVPTYRDDEGRWWATESTRTAHLADLVGCDGIAVVPPGTVSGDRVEILPLPTR